MIRSVALIFVLIASTTTAYAQDDYRCVIERIEHAAASDSVKEMYERIYLGKEFTVERRTGLMAGVLKNGNVYTEPEVIDRGSAENAYKVVTTLRVGQGAGQGSAASLLTVNEFIEGPKKPFLYAETDVVYFGVCSHF